MEPLPLPKKYSNIPLYKNIKKGILDPDYRPFTMEHMLRKIKIEPKSRCFFK